MHDFSNVDSAPRPLALVGILDALGALPSVAAYKARALELLRVVAGQRVLELGCGAGDDAVRMAERVGPYGLCVGADLSATMVREARDRHASLRLEFLQAECRRLPFRDGAFDACRIDRVLHMLDDPRRGLSEAVRVTRPGGRLVVSEPDWTTLTLSPDEDPLTRLIQGFYRMGPPAARVGRDLGALFETLPLAEMELHPFTGVVTRLDQARRLAGLDDVLGLVEPAAGAEWLAQMEAAEAAGRFSLTLRGVTAAGTVSWPPRA